MPAQAAPLSELARLEWAFTLAFDAIYVAPLSLAADETTALQGMIEQGWRFAELCGEWAHLGEQAPIQAVSWLRQWLSDGLLQAGAE